MTLSRRDVGDVHLGDAGAIGYGERRRSGQLPGTVIPHAGPAASTPLALAITMIEPALVGPTVPSPRGTIRPTSGGPSAKRSAVNLPAITWRTDREERAAQRTASKPKVEHVLACADLLPRSSSRARLHPSTRPRSTWKAGSWRSRPSSYRRLDVVPGGPRPTKFLPPNSGRRSHGSEWPVTHLSASAMFLAEGAPRDTDSKAPAVLSRCQCSSSTARRPELRSQRPSSLSRPQTCDRYQALDRRNLMDT